VTIVVAIVVIVVVAVGARNTYFIITWERQDFVINRNESAHCRFSSDEATVEMLSGESNNVGVITGLALGRQQLPHEVPARIKNLQTGTSGQD